FEGLAIPQLATPLELADWLMIPIEQLDHYVDRHGWREEHNEMAMNHYFTHLSRKSSGGLRVIEAPKPRLKSFQRLILQNILTLVPAHPDSFAFTSGRNCVDGAKRHAGAELVVCFDLKDYFSSVQSGRIFGLFRCLGFPVAVARALTGLCTVVTPSRVRERLPFHKRQALRAPHLPQGAPTSPALANLVSFGLDRRLAGLARSLDGSYSRYADDITFSGDASIHRALQTAVPEIVRDEGFTLNAAKTRVMHARERQMITGIVVNEKLNITRREFDRLKAVIHAKAWRDDPALSSRLLGQIGWVAQVNPAKAEKLRSLMARG
ncbi:MAG: reverse transcriptase family protein, partial [Pseudomonadota bacterium]